MKDSVIHLQRRIGAWAASRRLPRRDDTGAVSVETAIITALLGLAAVGLAGVITSRIGLWEGEIPMP
jgi:Flp pilus assembly pilin Flp